MGFLVFPRQINVTRPAPLESHPRTEVAYLFSGSIETIYASLVVLLSYTDHFQREDQWKYAVEFSRDRQRLGFSMQQVEEGTGELEIFPKVLRNVISVTAHWSESNTNSRKPLLNEPSGKSRNSKLTSNRTGRKRIIEFTSCICLIST